MLAPSGPERIPGLRAVERDLSDAAIAFENEVFRFGDLGVHPPLLFFVTCNLNAKFTYFKLELPYSNI